MADQPKLRKRSAARELASAKVRFLPHCWYPLPAGHKGTTYPANAIRITGDPEFVRTVQAELKAWFDREGVKVTETVLPITAQNGKDYPRLGLSDTPVALTIRRKPGDWTAVSSKPQLDDEDDDDDETREEIKRILTEPEPKPDPAPTPIPTVATLTVDDLF